MRRIVWLSLLAGTALSIGAAAYALTSLQQREKHQAALATSALGSALFHDTSLSATGTLACATCHRADYAFTQPEAVPHLDGGRVGTRNAPSLLDLPYFQHYFWDGREDHIERVAVAAFTNRAEMAQPNMAAVVDLLRRQPAYRQRFQASFGDDNIDEARISRAILAYLHSVANGHSRYDAYAAGDTSALTESERRGLAIFQGKADCAACHRLDGTPATFTDNRFHHSNVGLEQLAGHVKTTIAAFQLAGHVKTTIAAFQAKRQQGVPLAELVLSDPEMAALGRFAVDGHGDNLSAYRTPTLRNVTRTAPYMHDGSVPSLDAAIQREIYYRSLTRGTPITLTTQEQGDLHAFLYALEDAPLRNAQAPGAE
ncbi:cytochrome-c peroxidase [Xanthomonas albilineans]|uniref:cytochrome-c peroxidase n=1 Tax=Xanthomonas albilineans TaxID=29447 RepID=UPI0005F3336E|nr:cytochrome c peroxidase [Xanthomonas albilineans]